MPLKIIGAGLGRTGTHSLCTALEMLGYRTHHGTKLMTGPTEHLDVWMRAKQDPNHEDEWDRVYEGWDAAIDWPTCTFYKEIIEKYPDAKVILTVRSGDSWYDSMCKTIFRDIFLVKKEEVPEHVHRVAELCRAIMCDGDTADLENPERTRAKLVKFFDDHVEEVKRTVPADRLLIMELGEGWEKLCPFLGVDIPKEPYPRTNSSSQFLFQSLVQLVRDNEAKNETETSKAANTPAEVETTRA